MKPFQHFSNKNYPRVPGSSVAAAALLAFAVFAPHELSAAVRSWSAAPASGLWSLPANWGGTGPSLTGDSLTFATSGITALTDDMTGLQCSGVTFTTGASAFTITLNTDLAIASAGSITMNSGVSNNQTFAGSGAIVVGSGTGAATVNFTNNATGTLILNTNVNAGTTAGGTLTLGGTGGGSVAGCVANPVGLLQVGKSGTGTWTLTASNTYAGATTIDAGTLSLGGANGSATGTGGITVNSGGTLKYDNSSTAGMNANRLGNVPVTLAGGTLTCNNDGGNVAYSATVNQVTVAAGKSSGLVTAAAGTSGSSTVTINTLNRGAGAVLSASLPSGGTARNKVLIGNGNALPVNGIIPWLFESSGNAVTTYDSTNGLRAVTSYQTGPNNTWVAGDNVKLTTGTTVLTGSCVVNSLSLAQTSAVILDLGGYSLSPGSGALLASGNYAGTIRNGTFDFGSAEGAVSVTANTLTISANIAGSGGLTKSGSGGLTLSGTNNTWTGPTAVAAGTLTVAGTAALGAGSPTTVGGLATLVNSGTIGGTLTVNPTANATLNGGSVTNNLVANGNVTLAGSVPLTINTIQGSGGTGVITYNNTNTDGNALTFTGTNNFSRLAFPSGASLTLTLNGAGSVNTLYQLALPSATGTATFNGGTWNVTVFSSNSGAQYGNFNITGGAALSLLSSRFGLHGTWNISNGSLTWIGATNEGTAGLGYQTTVSGQGAVTWQGNLGILSTASASTLNNFLSVLGGSATVNGNLTIGDTQAQSAETNSVTLSGGKLLVTGTIAGGTATANQTNSISLTGGTLAVGTYNAANLGGGLVNNGCTLAPGDVNGAGLMTVTGGCTLNSGTLAIEISGTTKTATAFSGTTGYDNLTVNGPLALGGNLAVFIRRPFTPLGTDTFTIVTSGGSSASISGSFQNVAFGTRMTTADGNGSFLVNQVGNSIILSQYVDNFLPLISIAPVATQAQQGLGTTLSVTASDPSNGTLSYQWYRNGTAIGGATGSTLTIGSAAKTDTGSYTVVIGNTYGSTTSPPVTLYVIDAVALAYQMDQTPLGGANAIIDSTGNTAGTLSGTPLPALGPGASGATGSCWDFTSATTASLAIPATTPALQNVGNLRNATGMTIAFWYNFNQDIITDWQFRNVARFGNTFNISFYQDFTTASLNFSFGNDINTPAFSVSGDTRATHGNQIHGGWHHYAVTLDYRNPVDSHGVSLKNVLLYVDGYLQGTYPNTGQLAYVFQDSFAPSPADSLVLSATPQKWDQFMILNYPMSQQAIQQLCTTGSIATHAPMVTAGATPKLTVLPTPLVTLSGAAMNFGQGTATTAWSVASAPTGGSVTFGDPSSPNTTATFNPSVAGTYVLALTASYAGLHSSTTVNVQVVAPTPPAVYATAGGLPTTGVLTGASLALNGACNSYGVPNPQGATYSWTLSSGPGTATFSDATQPSPSVSFSAPGTYVLQLAATAGTLTGTTTMTIQVADTLPPVVTANATDPILLWPAHDVSLTGSATQSNPNNTLSYTWSQLSGSGTVSFDNPSAANTTAHFPAAGIYSLQLAVSDGISTGTSAAVWVNIWAANPGTDANVRPPHVRQMSPVPAPYVHPRFYFTEADRPDLTARANGDATAMAGIAAATASVNTTLLNPASPPGRVYQQMLAGNTGYSTQAVVTQQSFYKLLSQAAYLAWIQQNTVWLQQLATVLANTARNETIWAGTNSPSLSQDDDLGLFLAYDLTFHSMTEDQRVDTRVLLAQITRGKLLGATADWNYCNVGNLVAIHKAALPMAFYGETGYDAATASANFTCLKAFYSTWGISRGGIPRDDIAYHDGWDQWGLASILACRGIEPLQITSRISNESQNEFYFLAPNTITDAPNPVIYGHDDGQGWAQQMDTVTIRKYLYPTEQLEDFVSRISRKAKQIWNPLTDAIFGVAPLATPPTFASVSADRGLPLTKFDPQHGIGMARSDWSVDGTHLEFEDRMDVFGSGHMHAGRCNFTLFGVGRSWVNDSGYHENVNESHSTVLIDGIGQANYIPGQILDVVDHPGLTLFSGEAADAYRYSFTGYPSPANTTNGTPAPFTWGTKFFQGNSDGTIPAFTAPTPILGNNAWTAVPFYVTGTGSPTPYNPVQRAYVTAMLVRGTHPYALVLDDIQKDSAQHLYQWSVCMDSDMQLRAGTTATDAVVVHSADSPADNAPQCLVRAVQADGTPATITLQSSAINGQTETRLMIPRTAVAPNFKVLLYPHRNGEILPTTTLAGNVLTVTLADGQTDQFTFTTGTDGRSQIAFARPSDRTAPVVQVPGDITVDVIDPGGAPITYTTSAFDNVDGPVATINSPPSVSSSDVGTTTVTVTATDNSGNLATGIFHVTVNPLIPAAPAGLAATSGAEQIVLNWSDTRYATSYNIKRSTVDGGPYTTVASSVSGTTYTDTGLPGGVTCYYVVSAVNSRGEGPNSAQAGATPSAVTQVKADNATGLNLGGSWTGGVVPTPLNTASWTGTYAVGNAAASIGTGLSVNQIQIVTPSRAMTISAGSGSLNLAGAGGAGIGIDMSAATQNFTIAAPILLGNSQTWVVNTGKTLTASGGIDQSQPALALTKTGSGTLTLSGTGLFTGGLNVNAGTLNQNGTLGGVLGIAAGATANLSGGSTSGPVTPGGSLNLTGSTALTVGAVSGSGATGTINDGNTLAGGITLTIAPGSQSFASIKNSTTAGSLTLNASGSVISAGVLGYNTGTGWSTTLNGGIWTVGNLGVNGTTLQNGGTYNITGNAVVTVTAGRFGGHGTFNVGGSGGAGRINFGTSFSSENGVALGFVANALNGGVITTVSNLVLALPNANVTATNALTVQTGGQVIITGALTLGNTTTGKTETNTVNLQDGKLLVSGAVSAATATTGQTRTFNWNGGQLTAATITTGAGFNTPAGGGISGTSLVQTAGTLAPGDMGTAGKTAITGNYTLNAGGTLATDVGGTSQATTYQNAANYYDYVTVSGSTSLSGNLSVTLTNGFLPGGDQSFTLLNSTGAFTGAFANVAFGSRINTTDGNGSFLVTLVANKVILGSYLQTMQPSVQSLSIPPVSARELVAPAISLAGTQVTLTVRGTVRGRTYQLQRSPDLQPGSWVNIGNVSTGDGGDLTLSDSMADGAKRCFYRVRLDP